MNCSQDPWSIFDEKGFPPLCITKQQPIHPTIGAGAAAQISPKKNKEERKRNKCQQRQIDETKMPGDRCTLRRSTTTFPAPEARVPSNTFKKEATMTPLLPGLVLGFPPVRRRAVRGGVYPTPFRKIRRHPQASPRRGRTSRQRFLPTQTPTTTPDES